MRILFISDLHLSVSEKSYSFSVLDDIFSSASDYDMVFFLGDTFDSFSDMEALRHDYRKSAEKSNAPIYLIIGNHERIGAEKDFDMSSFDLGRNVVILDDKTFSVIKEGGVEVISISYKDVYEDYAKWHVPAKSGIRLLLMHGVLENTMYFSDEKDLAAIPKNIAGMFSPNMMIFGHIHQNIDKTVNIEGKNINLIYPGSARVCRNSKSEMGEKVMLSLEIEKNTVNISYILLKNAGRYERHEVSINGDYQSEIKKLSSTWESNDSVDIFLCGVIKSDSEFEMIKKSLEREYKNNVRLFSVKNGGTFFLSNVSDEKIISEFISLAESMKGRYKDKLVENAKIIGIEKIVNAVKARQ